MENQCQGNCHLQNTDHEINVELPHPREQGNMRYVLALHNKWIRTWIKTFAIVKYNAMWGKRFQEYDKNAMMSVICPSPLIILDQCDMQSEINC